MSGWIYTLFSLPLVRFICRAIHICIIINSKDMQISLPFNFDFEREIVLFANVFLGAFYFHTRNEKKEKAIWISEIILNDDARGISNLNCILSNLDLIFLPFLKCSFKNVHSMCKWADSCTENVKFKFHISFEYANKYCFLWLIFSDSLRAFT